MNIESTRYVPPMAALGLGPEATIEALVLELAASSHEARHDQRRASERRIEAAEQAIEHTRDAERARLLGSILEGVGTMAAQAVGGWRDGLAGASTARAETARSLTGSGAGLVATGITHRASRASTEAAHVRLESERAGELASEAGELEQRQQSMHSLLTRQLEEMMRARHRSDFVAVSR